MCQALVVFAIEMGCRFATRANHLRVAQVASGRADHAALFITLLILEYADLFYVCVNVIYCRIKVAFRCEQCVHKEIHVADFCHLLKSINHSSKLRTS